MNDLQRALQKFFNKPEPHKLKEAAANLTSHYKKGGSLKLDEELMAYLAMRLPATYAALRKVLAQLSPGSILDIGAGPGTTWWAARSIWEESIKITAYERESTFIELGKKLMEGVESVPNWVEGSVLSVKKFEPHDWVVFGYSLGELPKEALSSLLKTCWSAAQRGVVIVEPGTPKGYQNILLARDLLIQEGGSVFAPCPHSNRCPLQDSWCHFSVRIERTSLHKQLKNGSLGFEDEKFSYVIVTKENVSSHFPRIIDHPKHHTGHSILSLCSSSGLKKVTISRSQKEAYRKARKAHWGDLADYAD